MAADRKTPDALKAEAHAMVEGLFETWIRTAGAILRPGGQMSLIARPQSIADIIAACGRRFGGIEITPLHPRPGENAVRILVTAHQAEPGAAHSSRAAHHPRDGKPQIRA